MHSQSHRQSNVNITSLRQSNVDITSPYGKNITSKVPDNKYVIITDPNVHLFTQETRDCMLEDKDEFKYLVHETYKGDIDYKSPISIQKSELGNTLSKNFVESSVLLNESQNQMDSSINKYLYEDNIDINGAGAKDGSNFNKKNTIEFKLYKKPNSYTNLGSVSTGNEQIITSRARVSLTQKPKSMGFIMNNDPY